MNYTTNYHLPQWEETDRIMRADFNQMCADMEAGLKKTADDAAAATAEADAHAASAEAKAVDARAAADAAQATANAAYCPTNLPYVTGTYVGTSAEQTITLGFQPSFLIISHNKGIHAEEYFLAAGKGMNSNRLQFTAAGFKVFKDGVDETSTICAPIINFKGVTYAYIAFR